MPKDYHLYLKGSVGDWYFSPDMVSVVLDRHKDKEVHVLIDSLGGAVNSALSISSLFALHGNVHCHYISMNASAATIASMGAKRITIDADACFLVHKCMNFVFEWDWMNADELDAHIAQLQKMKEDQETIDGCIAGMYAKRCKKPKDELLALMKKGGWMTAKQALEWGFVDEITNNPEDTKPELTDSVVNFLAEAGIPKPPVNVKKDSVLAKFLALFKNSSLADNQPDEIQSPQIMANIATLTALLGADVTVSSGNVTISEAQAVKINDELDAKNNDINAKASEINQLKADVTTKDARIAELEGIVNDLRKEPASPSGSVVDHTSNPKDDPIKDEEVNEIIDDILKIIS